MSIRLSGSIKTSNYPPCFRVHISLYTWCPLIKVSRSKVVIKTIGSSCCKHFFCYLESEYTNTQRAKVQRWIISVAQNYAMEWCHRFFKTNINRMFWFECSFGWKFLFVESYLQDSCWFIIMTTIASKRINTKSIKDKHWALKEVEDGKTKSQVAAKYGIPKNTLSTWLRNMDKIFQATKRGSNSKRQGLR